MPNTADLIKAIETRNLDGIQILLTPRDGDGRPLININDIPGYQSALHLICFMAERYTAVLERQKIREMFEFIINLRLLDGNTVANPNIMHLNSGNIVTSVVNTGELYLLQLLLDLRNNRGEMVVDIYAGVAPGNFWSPLRRAIFLDNIDMVRAIVDARKADGSSWLTRDNIRTDLRGATSHDFGHGAYVRNNQCVIYLNNHLRMHAEDNGLYPIPPLQIPQNDFIAQDRIERFNRDMQNTHDPSVTQTAKGSLLALDRSYGRSLDESLCISEIERIVAGFNYQKILLRLKVQEKKDNALEFLNLLKTRYNTVHSYTGFTIKKVLALVWMAIKDQNIDKFPEEIRRTFQRSEGLTPDSIIEIKKSSFIEKFIEAAREYKDRGSNMDICAGGSIHKLLEALNHAHVDVVITTGSQSINPAANEMALAIVGQQLRKKSRSEQSLILSNWDADIREVAGFKRDIVEPVDTGLKTHFGTLLTEQQRYDIVASLPDLPRPPVPNKALNEMVDLILNTVQSSGDESKKICVGLMHQLSKTIYFTDTSDEERYAYLNSEYEFFKNLMILMEKIRAEKNNRNMSIILSEWNALIDLSESICSVQNKSFKEKYEAIEKNYCLFESRKFYFLKYDDFLKDLAVYTAQLDRLISDTDCIEYKTSMSNFLESLKNKIQNFQKKLSDISLQLPELIKGLEKSLTEDVIIVQNDLEKEPGIWRNLNPIIKAILGVIAALTVIPAILVGLFSRDGFMGTFFKKPNTHMTRKFEFMSLNILPHIAC
jgi:hypothetical protein